jgi:tetratricopeptide (TPR) repeat protein
MKPVTKYLLTLALLFSPLIPAHSQTYADELRLGTEAYKNSHYDDAIQHYRTATELDSSQPTAHMYLGTAYTGQFIPGVDSPENLRLAEQAVAQYLIVLDLPTAGDSKPNAAKSVAYIYLNTKKFDDAKHYYQMASGLDPKDPEPYYSVGVIDWTLCYQPRMEGRTRLKLSPEAELGASKPREKKICEELGARNMALIAEGMESLNRAIELRPDYDDAMAYLNLMYRERADLECNDPAARKEDLQRADHWVDRTLAVKKAKANLAASTQP